MAHFAGRELVLYGMQICGQEKEQRAFPPDPVSSDPLGPVIGQNLCLI